MLSNSPPKHHILFVAPKSANRDLIADALEDNNHCITHDYTYEKLAARSDFSPFNLILIQLSDRANECLNAVKELHLRGITLPVIGLTTNITDDLSYQAKKVGLCALLGTPVLPERLLYTIDSASNQADSITFGNAPMDPKSIMLQTLELAVKSATNQQGRAFGAILADKNSHIIAEGHAPSSNNKDPLNFAESSAIRHACEKLKTMDLSDYVLFSSFEPTNLGKSLIKHVKIRTVYYSLTPADIKPKNPETIQTAPRQQDEGYQQICLEEAKRIFSIKN